MMRSLYSGISGLKNHQTRMDVIGNNIANVNTVGFKASRVMFQDIYSQTIRNGSAGDADALGGTNPSQIGLGVKLSSIDVIHTNSATQGTDNPYDLAIDGDGFFIVADYSNLDANGDPTYMYTRVGNFKLDDNGYLVTSDGYYVMGYEIKSDGATPPKYTTGTTLEQILVGDSVGFGVDFDGTVTITEDGKNKPIYQISLALFANPSGLEKAGSSLYRETIASGTAQDVAPRSNGAGRINGGGLEMSNVDLASEFTDMIVTQRGYQANSRIITVSDSMLEELVNLKR